MAPIEPLTPSNCSMMSDVPVNAVMTVFAVTTYAPAGTVMLVTREHQAGGLVLGAGLANVLVGDLGVVALRASP